MSGSFLFGVSFCIFYLGFVSLSFVVRLLLLSVCPFSDTTPETFFFPLLSLFLSLHNSFPLFSLFFPLHAMSSSKSFLTYQRRSKSKSSDRVDFIPTIPRAPRTRSSYSVPTGDSSPFVSLEAASFFDGVISKRKFVPERSYQIEALPLTAQDSATQILEHYHLHSLNSLSGKFNASVIKEFYLNFPADPKESNYQIVVRSMPITLRPSIINQVLGFRSCPGFDFEKFAHDSS